MDVPQTGRHRGESYRQYVTLYRPSKGSKYYRLLWTDPVTGKRRERKGGTTLAGARAKADEIVARLMEGSPPESARATMLARDAFAIYVRMDQHPKWQEREQQNQASRYRVWIDPVIGNKRCAQLRCSDLEAVLASMRDATKQDPDNPGGPGISRGIKPATMQRARSQLGQWARWLHENGYTTSNIAAGLDLAKFLPTRTQAIDPLAPIVPPSLIPSQNQCNALADALDLGTTPWWGLACRIASTVGPRYGELAAMDLDSVDLTNGTLSIRRSLVPVPKSEANPLGWKWGMPKSRQFRQVPILKAWRPALETRMAEVEEEHEAGKNEYRLLFPSLRGRPYRQNNWYGSTFRKAVERLPEGGWPFTWHATRHAAASWMLHTDGMLDTHVATILGHSDPQFTRDRYLGVERGYLDRSAGLLDAALG